MAGAAVSVFGLVLLIVLLIFRKYTDGYKVASADNVLGNVITYSATQLFSEEKSYEFGSVTITKGKWIVMLQAQINRDISDNLVSIALANATYIARGISKGGGGVFSTGFLSLDTATAFSFQTYGYTVGATMTARLIAVRVG